MTAGCVEGALIGGAADALPAAPVAPGAIVVCPCAPGVNPSRKAAIHMHNAALKSMWVEARIAESPFAGLTGNADTETEFTNSGNPNCCDATRFHIRIRTRKSTEVSEIGGGLNSNSAFEFILWALTQHVVKCESETPYR